MSKELSVTTTTTPEEQKSPHSLLVAGGRYELGKRLGGGSFGELCAARDVRTGEAVAVKLESITADIPQLGAENIVYSKILQNRVDGFPRVYWYGIEGEYRIMVMELLGPSVERLFQSCNRQFSLPTVCWLGVQMLTRLETLHSFGIIHRDLKPDNFLMSLSADKRVMENDVRLIDFGLAEMYRLNNQHVPYSERAKMAGTARYFSVRVHLGIQQSRRDDVESLGHILLYLLRGNLPWQRKPATTAAAAECKQKKTVPNVESKYSWILDCKLATSLEELCRGFPRAFLDYMVHCRGLAFEQAPDYAYCKQLFVSAAREAANIDILAARPAFLSWLVRPTTTPKKK